MINREKFNTHKKAAKEETMKNMEKFYSFFCEKCDEHYFKGIRADSLCPKCGDNGRLLNPSGMSSLKLPYLLMGKENKVSREDRERICHIDTAIRVNKLSKVELPFDKK